MRHTAKIDGPVTYLRRLRFSLLALLAVVTGLCCALALVAYDIRCARRERDAVAALRALDARVYMRGVLPVPAAVYRLVGAADGGHVWAVTLGGSQATNEDIACLPSLKGLEQLILHDTAVDDGGIETLCRLRSLRLLILDSPSSPISDEGEARLRRALPSTRIYVVRKTQREGPENARGI